MVSTLSANTHYGFTNAEVDIKKMKTIKYFKKNMTF